VTFWPSAANVEVLPENLIDEVVVLPIGVTKGTTGLEPVEVVSLGVAKAGAATITKLATRTSATSGPERNAFMEMPLLPTARNHRLTQYQCVYQLAEDLLSARRATLKPWLTLRGQ
jgi:hypothetical protein